MPRLAENDLCRPANAGADGDIERGYGQPGSPVPELDLWGKQ
jgi:hypothetical protein